MLDDGIKQRLKSYCDQTEISSRLQSSLSKPKAKAAKPKSTPKLWELSAEVLSLEYSISEIQEDDNLSDFDKETLLEELLENWLGTGKEFDSKACNVAAYIKHLEALTEARKAEYRRLRELAEQSEKQAERIRAYLVAQMEKTGKKKINGVTASLSLRKKPAKVVLEVEPELLPLEFQKIEVTPRLTAIKEYLKSNPNCGFASMAENQGFSVTIK